MQRPFYLQYLHTTSLCHLLLLYSYRGVQRKHSFALCAPRLRLRHNLRWGAGGGAVTTADRGVVVAIVVVVVVGGGGGGG